MKKKYLLYILPISIAFLLTLGVLAACTYERGPMQITLTAPPVEDQNTQKSVTEEDQMVYPNTPETLVQAFMLSLQANPELSSRYLSKSLRSTLPVGGPADLLSLSGVIEGVAIQSGAASLEPPAAQVDVGLQVNGQINQRRFHLIKEEDRWAIDQIEIIQ